MTFLELIYQTLEKQNGPLTISQIWDKSEEFGFRSKLASTGKTPIKTLAARLYLDIRDNPNTKFSQISKRPATFYIKDRKATAKNEQVQVEEKTSFNERDLHPLLSSFVYVDSHFNCVTKTIHHEKSRKKRRGMNEWLHPDLVGLYFPYKSFGDDTIKLINLLAIVSVGCFLLK